jgi:hypothetical protein
MHRRVLSTITLSKSSIIIYQTRNGQLIAEILRESIQVHFLERGEAVRHDDACQLAVAYCRAWSVQPSSEGDIIGCLELDIFARHLESRSDGSCGPQGYQEICRWRKKGNPGSEVCLGLELELAQRFNRRKYAAQRPIPSNVENNSHRRSADTTFSFHPAQPLACNRFLPTCWW